MMNIILALLGLGADVAVLTMDQARAIHARLAGLFAAAIALIFVEVILNLLGVKGINLVILMACNIVLIIVLTRPEVVGSFLGFFSATGMSVAAFDPNINLGQGLAQGSRNGLDRYIHAVVEIMLWLSTVSLFLGIIPLWGRFWAGWIIVCAIIVIKLVSIQLHSPPIFYKVARSYAYIVLIIGILSAIPSAVYVKIFGFDILSKIGISEVEDRVDRVEKADRERQEEIDARNLEALEKTVRKTGIEGLSPRDKELWESLKAKRNRETVSGAINSFNSEKPIPRESKSEMKVLGSGSLTQFPAEVKLTGDLIWSASINVPQGIYEITCDGGVNRAFDDRVTFIPPEGRKILSKSFPKEVLIFSRTERYGEVLAKLPSGEITVIGRSGRIEGGGKICFSQNFSDFSNKNTGETLCKIEKI